MAGTISEPPTNSTTTFRTEVDLCDVLKVARKAFQSGVADILLENPCGGLTLPRILAGNALLGPIEADWVCAGEGDIQL
eukprot:6407822-Alexandrium_andersonii.AAC.1